jgi:D-glycero-alpha-D-manno-heptose-7-phosphate kinase
MTELAVQLRLALTEGETSVFGDILHRGWLLKRELASGISSSGIDELYGRAMAAGAGGGKLLGAGGGGFLLFYCEEERQAGLRSALSDLVELPFSFENGGAKVIYAD